MKSSHRQSTSKPRRAKDTAWVLRNRKFTGRMGIKTTLVFGLIMAMMLGLAGRLFYLCVFKSYDYSLNVMSNYNYLGTTVEAPRGTITDRNGNILAYSEMKYMIILEPKTILDSEHHYSEATLRALEKILGLDVNEVNKVLKDMPESYYFRFRNADNSVMEIDIENKEAYDEARKAVNVTSLSKKSAALAKLFDMTEEELVG